MKTQTGPEVEPLEMRQLPHGSLSAAGISSIHPPPDESVATEDSSSLVVLRWGFEEDLGQEKSQGTGDSPLSQVPHPAAAVWPTPPLDSNGSLGQATDPTSSNDLSNNAVSLQELKENSVRPNNAEKPVSLPEHSSGNESLSTQEARPGYPNTKQPEKSLPGGQVRFSSDELPFREESGVPVSAKSREQSLPVVHNRLASEAASPVVKRASRLASRPRSEPTSREVEAVFSFLAYDRPNGDLSFRLVEWGGLNAKRVERFFSSVGSGLPNTLLPTRDGGPLNLRQLEKLLANWCDALPGLGPSLLRATRPEEGQRAEGREELAVPPLYLSVVLFRQPGKPLDPSAQQGLDRLCAYAWSSIRNAERAHGEKFLSPEDIVQEIYLEWRSLVGPQPQDEALSRLLQDGSEEMKLLRVAVQRVIGRARYQQRQWTKAVSINQPASGSLAFARRGDQERIDWEDFWENVVSTLAPHEKQVLELRKQGKTFAEIGLALGMPRQRACETYHNVVERLQKNYPDW